MLAKKNDNNDFYSISVVDQSGKMPTKPLIFDSDTYRHNLTENIAK